MRYVISRSGVIPKEPLLLALEAGCVVDMATQPFISVFLLALPIDGRIAHDIFLSCHARAFSLRLYARFDGYCLSASREWLT